MSSQLWGWSRLQDDGRVCVPVPRPMNSTPPTSERGGPPAREHAWSEWGEAQLVIIYHKHRLLPQHSQGRPPLRPAPSGLAAPA